MDNQAGGIRQKLMTGDLPCHFDGRGHLEGSCIAKGEGLLETKKQRRKRGGDGSNRDGDDGEDMYDEDEDSDNEEEEKKVWKPVSGMMASNDSSNKGGGSGKEKGGKGRKGSPPSKPPDNVMTAAATASSASSAAPGGGSLPGLDGDIASLTKEGIDWSKTSKYGKKSNDNFQKWLDSVAKNMHDQQVTAEDTLFTSF